MLFPHNGLFLGTQKEQRKNRMNWTKTEHSWVSLMGMQLSTLQLSQLRTWNQ